MSRYDHVVISITSTSSKGMTYHVCMKNFEVKIFGKSNGSLDGTSRMEVFRAPSKEELEKRLKDGNMAYGSIRLVEAGLSTDIGDQRSTPVAKNNMGWHDHLNRWLVTNLSAMNAWAFIIITIGCALIGGLAYNEFNPEYAAIGVVLGLSIGAAIGLVYCGLFAIVLTASKDLNRIARALESSEG